MVARDVLGARSAIGVRLRSPSNQPVGSPAHLSVRPLSVPINPERSKIRLCAVTLAGYVSGVNRTEQIFEEARSAGIDLDLIDTNLALPVAERWRQHDAAVNLAVKLEMAMKVRDAGLQHTTEKAR
jgi:hypothetical protein